MKSMLYPPVTELYVVCSWRRILTMPMTHFEAALWRAHYGPKFEQVSIVPWVEARMWMGV